MPPFIDHSGRRYGRLVVVRRDVAEQCVRWVCKCDCGAVVSVRADHLVRGATRSCGCASRDAVRTRCTTHGDAKRGKSRSPEYRTWAGMIQRCHRRGDRLYAYYGARGIRVCERWRHSYRDFLRDVGRRPGRGFSLDRIDNSKGYQPGNVRWATRSQQMRNTRYTRWLTVDGVTLCMTEWARRVGVDKRRIHGRLKAGWSARDAVMGKGR